MRCQLHRKSSRGFYTGISTSEIDTLAAETCAYMSQKHPDFSTLAARIAVSNLHKNTSDSFSETCRVLYEYKDKQGRPAALLSDEVANFVMAHAAELDAAVMYKRDYEYDDFGFKTLESRTFCVCMVRLSSDHSICSYVWRVVSIQGM